jgi:hypothetical protein
MMSAKMERSVAQGRHAGEQVQTAPHCGPALGLQLWMASAMGRDGSGSAGRVVHLQALAWLAEGRP